MPPKNFKSVSIPQDTYDELMELAETWQRELVVSHMSAGQTIARLVELQRRKDK